MYLPISIVLEKYLLKVELEKIFKVPQPTLYIIISKQ